MKAVLSVESTPGLRVRSTWYVQTGPSGRMEMQEMVLLLGSAFSFSFLPLSASQFTSLGVLWLVGTTPLRPLPPQEIPLSPKCTLKA